MRYDSRVETRLVLKHLVSSFILVDVVGYISNYITVEIFEFLMILRVFPENKFVSILFFIMSFKHNDFHLS